MQDDREDRRQRDLRDLEFYRQRVRPSATELWRTLEKPPTSSDLTLSKRTPGARADGRLGLTTPSSIAEIQAAMPSPQNWASAEPENPAAGRSHGDSVWPLVCTLIVLVVLALTDKVGRAVTVFPF